MCLYKRISSDNIGSYEYRNVFDAELLRDFEKYTAKYEADPQGEEAWKETVQSLAEEIHNRGLVYKRADQWTDEDTKNCIPEPRNTKFVQDILKLLRRGHQVGDMKYYSEEEISRIHQMAEKKYEAVFRQYRINSFEGKRIEDNDGRQDDMCVLLADRLRMDIQWYDACWRDWNHLLAMSFDTDNDRDMLYLKRCKWGPDVVKSIENIEKRLVGAQKSEKHTMEAESWLDIGYGAAFKMNIQKELADPEDWFGIDPDGSGYLCHAVYIGDLFKGDMSAKLGREYIPLASGECSRDRLELFYEYLQEYFDMLDAETY